MATFASLSAMILRFEEFGHEQGQKLVFRMFKRSARLTGRKRGLAFIALTAIVAAYVAGLAMFVAGLERRGTEAKSADAIVALTGGDARLTKAMALLANGRGKRLLISGVHADVTRDQLFEQIGGPRSLFDCCVDMGHGADSTIGNAKEAAAWAHANGYKSVILVTAAYHMPRSKMELAATMPDVRIVPQPVFPEELRTQNWWADRLSATVIVLEYSKYLFAWTRLAAGAATGLSSSPATAAKIDYGRARPGEEPQARWEAAQTPGS